MALLKLLLSSLLYFNVGLAQYVPEPYGWACYRMATKRDWPQCKSASKSVIRDCLCGVPEFVSLTDACLMRAVANSSDPIKAVETARHLSLCAVNVNSENAPFISTHEEGISPQVNQSGLVSLGKLKSTVITESLNILPISTGEIESAIKTAEWRMENDRRAETAGIILVGFWALVVLGKYLLHIIDRILPAWFVNPIIVWKPIKLVRARLLVPALGERLHAEPILGRFGIRAPKRIYSIIFLIFTCLNYTLMFIRFPYTTDNFIYTTASQQWNKSLAIRSAFMIMWKLPLIFGFAARNNIFMMIHHPWSLDTFNVFHKFLARLTVADIIIHGVAISCVKAEQGLYGYVWSVEYWIWGVVGVTTAAIITIQSIYAISRASYETFKILHVILVSLFSTAMWYHVKVLPYGTKHAYAIFGIWGFDHVMRIGRFLLAGRMQATLEHISDEISLISIREAPILYRKTRFAYFYLYVLSPRMFWQSHPFTVVQIAKTLTSETGIYGSESKENCSSIVSGSLRKDEYSIQDTKDISLSLELAKTAPHLCKDKLLMVAIKHRNGATKKIAKFPVGPVSIGVEGPYGIPIPFHRFKQVICIAGGIGITAHLSYIQNLIQTPAGGRITVKLYWAIKNIQSMEWALDILGDLVPCVQVEVFTSEQSQEELRTYHNKWPVLIHYGKLVCSEILQTEVAILNGTKTPTENTTAIFSCGPARLNDDARAVASWAIEHANTRIDYYEESFN